MRSRAFVQRWWGPNIVSKLHIYVKFNESVSGTAKLGYMRWFRVTSFPGNLNVMQIFLLWFNVIK